MRAALAMAQHGRPLVGQFRHKAGLHLPGSVQRVSSAQTALRVQAVRSWPQRWLRAAATVRHDLA
jgi:hypothetical protein